MWQDLFAPDVHNKAKRFAKPRPGGARDHRELQRGGPVPRALLLWRGQDRPAKQSATDDDRSEPPRCLGYDLFSAHCRRSWRIHCIDLFCSHE